MFHPDILKVLRFFCTKNHIIEPINTFKYDISHFPMKRKKDLDAENAFEEVA